MMNLKNTTFILFSVCLIFTANIFGGDDKWRPITPEEMQMKTPKVEPGADAEAIFWEVRVDDSATDGLSLNHYVRVKIFTEKGREDFAKHDIPYLKGTRVKDVEAKVTKPDGTTVFLDKDDVTEREIVKTNGYKIKAKSFALPGLEPGSIVEYRYREVIDNASAQMRLIFQRELPIETISYYVKPFDGTRSMFYQSFNIGNTKFEKDKSGFQKATMNNVPAYHEEPFSLPEDEVRSWMYIYYSDENNVGKPEAYWKDYGKKSFERAKSLYKVSDEVKKATAEAINGATTDEDKLRKIYEYCQTHIKNLNYMVNRDPEQVKKAITFNSPTDVLKAGYAVSGAAGDIDSLFGAMTRAAGFDSRLASSGVRSELFFHPEITNSNLILSSSSVAVKVGDKWQFFSPSEAFSDYGTLSWHEDGQVALISDPKELVWTEIPLMEAQKSVEKRTGTFKLLEDGTLVGQGRIEFFGHRGEVQRLINYDDSSNLREDRVKTWIRKNILGTAEIESVAVENVTETGKPFAYSFKIRVPGYASRTGKRMFIQPGVFERSATSSFSAADRKSDIYIDYPWAEQDNITIELPEGFALENPDAPAMIKDPNGIGVDEVKMSITKDNKNLIYKRSFSFGNGGSIRFPATAYPALKQMFEAFNKTDTHQLTLRQSAIAPPPPPKPSN